MKEGIIKDTYELIIKEIQSIITISYLLTVGIGMIFNNQKFSEFGINIFDYADVFDFLIAPFSDFYILLFATLSIILVSVIFFLDNLWKKKYPKSYSKAYWGRDKKPWFKTQMIILFIISFITYLYLSADFYGKFIKKKILNKDEITIRLIDNEIISGKLIGKTKDVVFILKDNDTYALPTTSLVKEIKLRNSISD